MTAGQFNRVTLDDKYMAEEGIVTMSGIQALVRLPMDQRRRDLRAGLNTATLISGYRGSPLGGYDIALERAASLLLQHHVRFIPGVNEDLAAGMIYGSQLANTFPAARYDGVLGIWYGKGPGVDRTGDALKHANFAGVGRNGGVLLVAGDDPAAKSSTIPSGSEAALFDAQLPILYPGNVQEILEFGLQGFGLSRYCGSWVGFKVVTNVADEFSSVHLRAGCFDPVDPGIVVDGKAWRPVQNPALLFPWSVEQEREIHEHRSQAAKSYAAINALNKILIDSTQAWLGIVCAGKTAYDVLEALDTLGIDAPTAERWGIRVLKLGMIHPLEPEIVRRFARGLAEVLIIEEKRSFIELLVRDVLYGLKQAPRVVGKTDEAGRLFVPGHGELDSDAIRRLIRQRLLQRISPENMRPEPGPSTVQTLFPLEREAVRTPYFCSGCPHNRSTHVPTGSMANGSVGCSTMAMWMDRATTNIVHMGGEGTQWIGAAPFSETPHIFQNMGDGTFLHSGSLALRQAVSAGTNITYKILYNAAVAMTGGQRHDAAMALPDIVRAVVAEGVAKVLVVSHQPATCSGQSLGVGVEVWHRDRLQEAQQVLRSIQGVSVLIYDQPCAADLRRKRKNGSVAAAKRRVLINEAVCEGCGDCGRKSNCLSVQPVGTPFGRKTQIHQSSCNQDLTCIEGLCPAFVLIEPGLEWKPPARISLASVDASRLREPERRVGDTVNILMTGVGGTGVVTVNQILATAARIQGCYSSGLDQTGLAQKGGSVVSHLKLSTSRCKTSNLIGQAQADVLLAFDLITAAQDKQIHRICAGRTIAIVNSGSAPSGPQVRDVDVRAPSVPRMLERLQAATCPDRDVVLDAESLSDAAFGDHMPANFIVLGAAYQAGVVPLAAAAIERAIELNGTGAKNNVTAFRLGRWMVQYPDWIASQNLRRASELSRPVDLSARAEDLFDHAALPDAVSGEVRLRFAELTRYQSLEYAKKYLDKIGEIARQEPAESVALTRAVGRSLFKLMAYKDEYEVARLHLLSEFENVLASQFGKEIRRRYLLQPPILEWFGVHKKIEFGSWVSWVFRALVACRRLRGTWADIFGFSAHRRLERALAAEYCMQIDAAMRGSLAEHYDEIVEIAGLAEHIRGYATVKEASVTRWRTVSRQRLDSLLKGRRAVL